MDWVQLITVIVAIIGAVTGVGGLWLGIVNRHGQRRYSPAKLRVIPMLAFTDHMDDYIPQKIPQL